MSSTHRFVTESGSRYELAPVGLTRYLFKHEPDGSTHTVVINVWSYPETLEPGAPAVFVGDHPHIGRVEGREYRITTSPVAEVIPL
jgi:hypothetical protein